MAQQIFAFLIALTIAATSVQAQTTCHAYDTKGNHFRHVVQLMMTSESAALRSTLAIPLVDSSQIVLVSDNRICARAGQALDSLATVWAPTSHGAHPSSGALYVFNVGTSFGVVYVDPRNKRTPVFFFNVAWAYTGSAS